MHLPKSCSCGKFYRGEIQRWQDIGKQFFSGGLPARVRPLPELPVADAQAKRPASHPGVYAEQCISEGMNAQIYAASPQLHQGVHLTQETVVGVPNAPSHRILCAPLGTLPRHDQVSNSRLGRIPQHFTSFAVVKSEFPELLKGGKLPHTLDTNMKRMGESEVRVPVHDLRDTFTDLPPHVPQRMLRTSADVLHLTLSKSVQNARTVSKYSWRDLHPPHVTLPVIKPLTGTCRSAEQLQHIPGCCLQNPLTPPLATRVVPHRLVGGAQTIDASCTSAAEPPESHGGLASYSVRCCHGGQ